MGKELGQVLVELQVVADDGADRRLHGLVAIALAQVRLQALLGFLRLHEDEARRRAVGARRAQLEHVDELVQQAVGHVLWLPLVVRAGVEEELASVRRRLLATWGPFRDEPAPPNENPA